MAKSFNKNWLIRMWQKQFHHEGKNIALNSTTIDKSESGPKARKSKKEESSSKALKSKVEESSNEETTDEQMALVMINFKRFMKKKYYKKDGDDKKRLLQRRR